MADYVYKTEEEIDSRSRTILETVDVLAKQEVREIQLEVLDKELANKIVQRDTLDMAISELQTRIASIETALVPAVEK